MSKLEHIEVHASSIKRFPNLQEELGGRIPEVAYSPGLVNGVPIGAYALLECIYYLVRYS